MYWIIVIHVAGSTPWYLLKPQTFGWQACNFGDAIARFGVPIFMMISGTLFLNPNRQVTTQHLFKKNIARLLWAYLVWSIVYTIYDLLTNNRPVQLSYIIEKLLLGSYHMWFVLAMVCLYLAVPIYRLITARPKLLRYTLALMLLFGCLLPSLLTLLKAIRPLMGLSGLRMYHALKTLYHASWCQFFTGFSLVYLGGYWLSQHDFSNKQRKAVYLLGLLGLLYTIGMSGWLAKLFGKPIGVFYDNLSWNVLAVAAAIFVFAKQHWGSWPSPRWLAKTANLIFGTYLVHVLILYLFIYQLHIRIIAHNPLWFVPLFSMLIFLISLGGGSVCIIADSVG
jgi:surface polysaccharide O-acyltransferase-like enzyme